VRRNDKVTVEDIRAMNPEGIVLSPGPCTPNEAGVCLDLISELGDEIPILGVCLGHQAIGQAYGGRVVRAPKLMHGKLSEVRHSGQGVFRGINAPFMATRYHSLTIAPDSVPASLEVTAEADDDVIMGVRHKEHPVHGVQFHPESIASEHGKDILRNFLAIVTDWNAHHPRAGA
jgi:anthranilate synthase component 2